MQISASNLIASQAYVRPSAGRAQNAPAQNFAVDSTAAGGDFSPLSFKTVDKADVDTTGTQTAANPTPTAPAGGYGATRLGSVVDITV